MKKLFLGMAVAASSLAFAQQFGVKGGMNVSSISKDGTLSDSKSKIGFNGGFFYNAPISSQFSIQPEVLYNNLGSKVTALEVDIPGSNNNITRERALNLDYISVPVMVQYNATPEFYLEAGPEFSFLIDSRSKIKNTVGDDTNSNVNDIDNDNFNSFNFGLGIGAGYWITPQFGINARYVAGLSKVGNEDTAYGRGFGDAKNNNLQVGLAYKFGR